MNMIHRLIAKVSPWYDEKEIEKRERLTDERVRRADLAYMQASKVLSSERKRF
jgi:hypothetical protein